MEENVTATDEDTTNTPEFVPVSDVTDLLTEAPEAGCNVVGWLNVVEAVSEVCVPSEKETVNAEAEV